MTEFIHWPPCQPRLSVSDKRNLQPMRNAVQAAIGITVNNIRGFESISAQAKNLSNLLAPIRTTALPPTDALLQDLRKIQESIDKLRQAVVDEKAGRTGQHSSSRQVERIATEAKTCQDDIAKAQYALDDLIRCSAERLSGSALKHFMKAIYPDPDSLIVHAERILPRTQQQGLVDKSKRLQRSAHLARPTDLGHLLERITGTSAQHGPASKAKNLSWGTTRTADQDQQKRGIGKLDKTYQQMLLQNAAPGEIISALYSLTSGMDNLSNATLRGQAQNILHSIPPDVLNTALAYACSGNDELKQQAQSILYSIPPGILSTALTHACSGDGEMKQQALIILSKLPSNLLVSTQPDVLGHVLAHACSRGDELKRQALSILTRLPSDVLASSLCNAIPAVRHDIALQDGMLSLLHAVSVRLQQEKITFTVEQKKELAAALAAIYTDHIQRSPEFASMRMRFVDGEVRVDGNSKLPETPVSFNVADDVIDLTDRKPTGEGLQGQGFTRPAQMLEIDGKDTRAKEIKYGPRPASSEATATTTIAATGQAAPKTQLGRYEEIPKVIVSQLIPGFMDLGDFVLDRNSVEQLIRDEWGEGKEELIDGRLKRTGLKKMEAAFVDAEDATNEFEALKSGKHHITIDESKDEIRCTATADDGASITQILTSTQKERLEELKKERPDGLAQKDLLDVMQQQPIQKRFFARQQVYKLLPAEFHQKMGKAQFLSQWIGDLDFLNYEWANAGFTKEGVAVVLDEGNAFYRGFRGHERGAANVDDANDRARGNDPYKPNQVTAEDHTFGPKVGASRTNVGRNARSMPIGPAVASFIQADTRAAEFGGGHKNMASVPLHEMHAFSGQMEGAFQLSLMQDDVIRRLVAKTWPEPDNEKVPYKDEDTQRRTAAEVADILIERRKALVGKFTPEELAAWVSANPVRAKAAYDQTAAAIADTTGVYIPPYTPDLPGEKATIRAMKRRNSLGSLAGYDTGNHRRSSDGAGAGACASHTRNETSFR